MLIYLSMIGWIALVAGLRRLSYGGKFVPQSVSLFTAIVTFGYIIFWVGIRSGVADTSAYIGGFENTQTGFSEILAALKSNEEGPLFKAFNAFFKTYISTDYHWWLMTIAIISGGLAMLALYRKSENFMFSAYLFMTMLFFTWMFNGMRQFLAAVIIFYFYPLIEQRKTIKFIIVVLICSLIHASCLIMIPIYFFVVSKPWSLQSIFFIAALMLAVIFIEPLRAGVENSLGDSHYGQGLALASRDVDDGVNPLRVVVTLVPTVIAFWKRKQIEEMDNKFINILINMSLVSAALYLIGVFTSGIFIGRLPLYTELGNLILLPFLIKNCFDEREKKYVYVAAAIGYFAFFWMLMKGAYYISDITGFVDMRFSANDSFGALE